MIYILVILLFGCWNSISNIDYNKRLKFFVEYLKIYF
jgi:hypothetical protein